MFDGYLFDLDGVLVDVSDAYKHEIFAEVEDELERSFTDDQIRNLWHGLGAESRDDILRSWGIDEPRRFWEVFDALDTPERRIEHTYAYEDADVVADIDAPTGVVTHSPYELAEPALERAGLDGHVDALVSCSYELGWKPDPAPIEKCAREAGAPLGEETVLIGDSASDVRGAWNAGIAAGHVDRVGHRVDADHNLDGLHEVRDWVANGDGRG